MSWNVEVTDTFGGEANYCWVRRYRIEGPMPARIQAMPMQQRWRAEQRWLMTQAKALAGYTGVRGRTAACGELIEWRPHGACIVMFVTWAE